MQTFLSRLRAAFAPRYDARTGRRRSRPAILVAVGVVMALAFGSSIAVAANSTAEAHVPTVEVSCNHLSVHLQWYPAGAHVTIVVNGVTEVDGDFVASDFDPPFIRQYALDPSVVNTYSIDVDAPDGAGGTEFDFHKSGSTTPCVTPDVSVTATACDVIGGSSDLTANFAGLDQSHTYTVSLSSAGGSSSPATAFVPTGTTGSTTFDDVIPGYTYTVTLTDTTVGLSGSGSVLAVGCPQDATLQVSATECSAAGGAGLFGFTANSLVNGRSYTVTVYSAPGNVVQDTVTFTADASGTWSNTFTVVPGASYYATIDDGTGTTKSTATLAFLPCPGTPGEVGLIVTQCNAADSAGAIAFAAVVGGTIGLTVTDLIPGRTYDIVITDAASVEVLSTKGYLATSSTYTADVTGLPAGVYTATVTDVLVPTYTSSKTATLLACPTYDTTITLTATQCTQPGDLVDVTATVANYTAGRPYSVTLTQNNVQVGATQTFDSSTGDPQTVTFSGLIPGTEYLVKVTDDLATTPVVVSKSILLDTCPGQPAIDLSLAACEVIGFTDILVSASELVIGDEYVVSLTATADGLPVLGLPDQQFTATADTEQLVFADFAPNGADYTVVIESLATALTDSATIFLKICDPPTFDFPDPPTLAFTGSGPMGSFLIAGAVLVQLGLAFLGAALIRRRTAEA